MSLTPNLKIAQSAISQKNNSVNDTTFYYDTIDTKYYLWYNHNENGGQKA